MDTISALRQICTNCQSYETDKWIGQHRFEARSLDRTQSVAARRGILDTAEVVAKGLVSVLPNALDGHEWVWEEFMPGQVQSRSTGGLGKFECGFDPQTWRKKLQRKRQHTERMYIHREECMLNYIGSTLQAGNRSRGPIYIQNDQNLITVAENRELIIDLLLNDFRSMARAVDGTAVLGNFAGENNGNIVGNGASLYPHFDGIIKQTLLQANASFYASVDVVVPDPAGGGYFVRWYGDSTNAYADVASLIAGINSLQRDVDGFSLYSATLISSGGGNNTIRITSNETEEAVYGEDALRVYYSATGTLADCDTFVDGTVVQNPMAYAEEPLLFDYSSITSANFYDYFKDVFKAWRKKMVRLFENQMLPDFMGDPYVAIDPLLLVDKDFALIEKLGACCDTGERQIQLIDQMMPRFEGLKVLEGTGLWYMTFPSNFIYLTNLNADILGVIKTWHDNDCDKVKGKLEMLGNVLIADFAMVATNAKGSSFESALKSAHVPENLSHLCEDVRQNCVGGSADSAFVVRAETCVTIDEGADTAVVSLQDDSIVPNGDSIASVVWTFYDAAGTPVTPAAQTTNTTVSTTNTIYQTLTLLTYQVTTTNGLTNTITIPVTSIVNC